MEKIADGQLPVANGEKACPQEAPQHTRPWESDVPQVSAVRRQVIELPFVTNSRHNHPALP